MLLKSDLTPDGFLTVNLTLFDWRLVLLAGPEARQFCITNDGF